MSGSNYCFYKWGTVVCYQRLSIVLIPSQVLFNVTKRAPIKEALFLAEREGFSPLAARPVKQRVSAVWFADVMGLCPSGGANRSLPFATPPSNPSQLLK